MKLLKLLFLLSLSLGSGFLQNTAYARSQAEVAKDLALATGTAVATYKKEGMSGLIIKTKACYEKNTKNPFYCVYLDLASRHIDQVYVESMHIPSNEFFSDAQFGPRIGPVLANANMDMNTANQYLASVTPVINNLVEKNIGVKTGNAQPTSPLDSPQAATR